LPFRKAKWQSLAFAIAFATGECIGLAIGLPMANGECKNALAFSFKTKMTYLE
jgi:hypothetical protein